MTSQTTGLVYTYRKIGRWTVPTIELSATERPPLRLPIMGYIGNSISTSEIGMKKLDSWKVLVASEIKVARGGNAWNPQFQYAIAISFSFNAKSHGNRRRADGQCRLDVENFIKPVIDALAAGLFCDQGTDVKNISRWDYDDSNFNTLLIHRLEDAPKPEGEGIAVYVSSSSSGG